MSRGRYHFTSREAQKALGISAEATRLALNRLARQTLIASPERGSHVVIPPEYRRLGCLPADQFIPALMHQHHLPYCVGLLSAAQFHGAAHHRPQEFQVMLPKVRRPIRCGQVRVTFIARKRLVEVPMQAFNTPRGTIQVSTPEATAIDLVGYPERAGGLDQVATVLSELAEAVDPARLTAAARTAPMPWAQRLGYLMDLVGAGEKGERLRTYVHDAGPRAVPLSLGGQSEGGLLDRNWNVIVNATVEVET